MSGADIAFMKPVDASSIYDDKHKPELLTNGQSCKDGTSPAAATKTEDKPFFKNKLTGEVLHQDSESNTKEGRVYYSIL